jgi:uncharacterized cysteine cluster protein YcgN (CxxCxxCC family)
MADKLLIKWERNRVTEVTDLRTGEKWVLKGECNRCGLCCTIKRAGIPDEFWDEENRKCKFLIIVGKLGEPNSSYCKLHTTSMFKPWRCIVDFKGTLEEVESRCTYHYEKVK